jgi:Pyruvate/2-oxoacid:ferredoxin oxidoreductase gamma subunit
VNTAIVGAASAVFGWFGMPAVEAAIEEEVPAKLEANVAAAREAAGAVRVADAREISHV